MTTAIIKVLVGDTLVGVIQSLSIMPTLDYPKISVSRMRLDKSRIAEAFSNGFVHHAAQKLPFQIVNEEDGKEIGRIHNAWLVKANSYYIWDDTIIVEDIELEAEKVSGSYFEKLRSF